MMRKLLILIVILVVVGVGVAYLAISNASSIISQYKPQLEAIASDAIGTKVSIGSISTSVFPETKLTIDRLSLGDSSKGESLSLSNVALRVSLVPLLQKKLLIEELILTEPQIKIIKNAQGVKIPGVPKKEPTTQADKAPASQPGTLPIDLSLDEFSVKKGTLIFSDETQNKEIRLSGVDIHGAISLENQLARIKKLALEGTLMNDVPLQVSIPDATFNLSSSAIESQKVDVTVGKNLLTFEPVSITKSGEISYVLKGKDLEAKTFVDALKQMSFMPATVALQGPLSLDIAGTLNTQGLTAKPLTLQMFGGTITAPSTLTFAEKTSYATTLAVQNIQIDKALEFIGPGTQSKLYGTVSDFSGAVSGLLGGAIMQESTGSFSFNIKDGGVRGVNIPGRALKAVDKIPFLAGTLYSIVPQQFRPVLESENTEYSSLTGQAYLRGGQITLKTVKLVGSLYSIEAEGTYAFDGTVDLNATLYFNKEFSEALIQQAHDLKKLLTAEGTLVFPITIQGKLPGVIIIPNITKLLETAGAKILTEKAGQAIGKELQKRGLGGIGSLLGF